ncbi:MAG: RNA polymerase-binding protein DksA [Desulfarculales bacterium]|jgi:DnaK suppressor protein|nr:RNA polymerase-binding protein DksA [Desulfarculales bacterium]
MDPEKIEFFRDLLQNQMDELLKEADRTVVGMTDSKENFPDPTDRAALESDRNFLLRIRDRERKLISKIKEALLRLEDDTYGICEACGEDISFERLKARPVTTLCVECKKAQEANERARGN